MPCSGGMGALRGAAGRSSELRSVGWPQRPGRVRAVPLASGATDARKGALRASRQHLSPCATPQRARRAPCTTRRLCPPRRQPSAAPRHGRSPGGTGGGGSGGPRRGRLHSDVGVRGRGPGGDRCSPRRRPHRVRGSCESQPLGRTVRPLLWYTRSVRPARYPCSAAEILRSVPQRDRTLLLRLGLNLDNPRPRGALRRGRARRGRRHRGPGAVGAGAQLG